MSGLGNIGIQVKQYTYDFAVSGGAVGTIDLSAIKGDPLPIGALVLAVSYYVETAPTSSGSATIAVGDADTTNNYLAATAYDNAIFADEYVASNVQTAGFKVADANDAKFGITIATAALTAGKIHFFVQYLIAKS